MPGSGVGKRLLCFGITQFGARFVDVNEQNGQAAGFYEKLGFRAFGRLALDEQGNPFPISHRKLRPEGENS